jgi:predicted homoserine dehydrogenase-like protein
MAQGLMRQVSQQVPGMRISAVCNRTIERALGALDFAGLPKPGIVKATDQMDDRIRQGIPCVTDDPEVLANSDLIDCLVDMTGSVEYGAEVAIHAIRHKKHLVLMNAELDATIGPILYQKAKESGVIISCADGDQPGVQMNLFRFVKSLGLTPRVLGNIKGLQDEYRTPTTQAKFAEQWDQNIMMVTSFADGSKVNFEQCIVGNNTGFTTITRGMRRLKHDGHVDDLVHHYDLDEIRSLGGIVDCVIGAKPSPGVFCLAELNDARQAKYLEIFKMGSGPLYSFYQPYHLCHLETPFTIARAVLFGDYCGHPLAGPTLEVVAIAKRDLMAGERLDGYGGYMTYGQVEKSQDVQVNRLLPQGLSEGCILTRDILKDTPLTWKDISQGSEQLAKQLYVEQQKVFYQDQ